MARVHIPAVFAGAGTLVAATCTVRLVREPSFTGAEVVPVIGFVDTDLATEQHEAAIPAAGLTVELAPTAAIALPGGDASRYQVQVRTASSVFTTLVQVADIEPVQELRDLVAAAPILPAALLVGQVLTAAQWAALDGAAAPGAENPLATKDDLAGLTAADLSIRPIPGTTWSTVQEALTALAAHLAAVP